MHTNLTHLNIICLPQPWLRIYLKLEPKLRALAQAKSRCLKSFDGLIQYGLRDGVTNGLHFRNKGALPVETQIRSVRELLQRLAAPGLLPSLRTTG